MLIFLTGILVGPSARPDLPIMLLAFSPLWFTNTSAIGWDAAYSKQIWPCKVRRFYYACSVTVSNNGWKNGEMSPWQQSCRSSIWSLSDTSDLTGKHVVTVSANWGWQTYTCDERYTVGDITVLTQSIHSVCISDIMWAGVNEGPTSAHNICENFSLCPWRMFLCSLNRWQIVFQ